MTAVPGQMEFSEGAMLTDGIEMSITVSVRALEVAVAGLAQAALLVRIQVMISLLLSELLVKVLPVVAMSFPLTCHR
jgi:hypothetical protein